MYINSGGFSILPHHSTTQLLSHAATHQNEVHRRGGSPDSLPLPESLKAQYTDLDLSRCRSIIDALDRALVRMTETAAIAPDHLQRMKESMVQLQGLFTSGDKKNQDPKLLPGDEGHRHAAIDPSSISDVRGRKRRRDDDEQRNRDDELRSRKRPRIDSAYVFGASNGSTPTFNLNGREKYRSCQ